MTSKFNVGREFENDIKKTYKEGETFMKDITDEREGFELEGSPEAESGFEKVEPWLYFKFNRVGQALTGIIDHIALPDEINKSYMLFLKDVNGVKGQNIKLFCHKDLEYKLKNIPHPEGKKVFIKLVDKTTTDEGREQYMYEVRVKK